VLLSLNYLLVSVMNVRSHPQQGRLLSHEYSCSAKNYLYHQSEYRTFLFNNVLCVCMRCRHLLFALNSASLLTLMIFELESIHCVVNCHPNVTIIVKFEEKFEFYGHETQIRYPEIFVCHDVCSMGNLR